MSGDMATDHVNGNGTEEPMDTTAAVTHSEHFPALLEAGLLQKVAEKLDELYVAGKQKFNLKVCSAMYLLWEKHTKVRHHLTDETHLSQMWNNHGWSSFIYNSQKLSVQMFSVSYCQQETRTNYEWSCY